MKNLHHKILAGIGSLTLLCGGSAMAAQPYDWQIWHQPAASPGMEAITSFSVMTLWIITVITIFVLGLLLYVGFRFRASANPEPSKTTHHTWLEVAWTVVPIIILLIIAIPSFKLLDSQFNPPEEPSITVKAVGYQWYWGYEYQDGDNLAIESRLIGREDGSDESRAKAEQERAQFGKTDKAAYPNLLVTDNELVVPVNKVIRVLVTAEDVIHAFALPAFGLKLDGIPGRINELYFQPTKEGIYFGQCSELCGRDHAFMPIAIRVVSQDKYDAWRAAAESDLEGANKALMAAIDSETNIKVAGNRTVSE